MGNSRRRDLQYGNQVYLSHDEQEPDNDVSSAQTTQYVRLNLKDYTEKPQNHAFLSEFKPDYLLSQLISKVRENEQDFEISTKTWKLNMAVSKNLNKEAAEGSPSWYERCNIQVEILKVKDQEKYCVEFQRKAGSAILFYDEASKYIDALELCNNTTYK